MYDDKPIKVDAGPKKINNIYMGPEVGVISIEQGKQNLFYRDNKKQFSSTFIILDTHFHHTATYHNSDFGDRNTKIVLPLLL